MPIETANFVSELVPSNPSAPDLVADTDNHLRLIKQALKNTFPNASAAVTSTSAQLNSFVPIGFIGYWYGTLGSIPAGWGLADGTSYTRTDGGGSIVSPVLVDKFIQGALADGSNVGTSGGSKLKSFYTNADGAHTHTGVANAAGSHAHGTATGATQLVEAHLPSHSHQVVCVSTEGGGSVGLSFGPAVTAGTASISSSAVGGNSAHNHAISADGTHLHSVDVYAAAAHTHLVSIADIRPPFYCLLPIMKI